jgi:acetylglutamate/LysW-gamma-L-alpha-aminoadipate kinase
VGGGSAINLPGIAADLAELGEPAVVVHGANALRDELAERLGAPKRVLTSVSGYSSVYSDDRALDMIMLAYAGLRNTQLVELCQRAGVNAVGLTGLDGRLIQGRRNKGIRVRREGRTVIERDRSGYTPVVSIPIADQDGIAINSENDDIVVALHAELRVRRVIQLIEAPGFLEHAGDESSVLRELDAAALDRFEAQADGRIKRKLRALKDLIAQGEVEVILCDGRTEHPLRDGLAGHGTRIG